MAETFPQAFGRYLLKERLALGGMAELFLAEVAGAHGFAKTVVIKRILPHLAADEKFTEMFISEAKITAQLAHPKIAQTYELGTEDKQLFIVMEFIDGIDVLAMLRESAHRRVRLAPEVAVHIVKEVLDALDFAHKLKDGDKPLGIVHRDVSPSNILLSKGGDIKLVDFGIAHAATQNGQTKAGTLKGKYGYMSPEQVLAQEVSPKSDVFAAGVVLAEMLMGRRLFAAANELDVLLMVRDVDLSRLERFGAHIEPDLTSIIHWALRKDPNDRYSDAATFRDALDEWLFEHRHRVTSGQLAEIVVSLYDAASDRRKESLEHIDSAPATVPPGPPAPPQAPASGSVKSSGVAIPQGVEVEGEDLSGEIELSLDEDVGPALDNVSEPPAAPRRGDAAAAGDEILSFELGDEASEIDVDLSMDLGTESGSVEVDFSSLGLETETAAGRRRPPRSGAAVGRDSYDNISAAVASVSPMKRDPSSRDFDDTDVSGVRSAPRPGEASSARHRPRTSTRRGLAAQSGSLTDLGALGTLYQTTAARESGQLVLALGGVRKEIFFKRGVPEFVSSNVASELFGAYLVRMKVITSGELDMALAVMPHFGGKLGDTLVGLSLMKPLEVFRHLTRQVRSKLIEVCTWVEGEYQWFPGVKCPQQAFPLDLDPLEVYGAGALAMPREPIELWLERRHDMRPVETRSSVVVPELFQVAGIRPFQQSLDGSRTVAEIVRESSAGDDGLHELRLLYLLVNTRLAVDVGDTAATIIG